MISIPSLVNTNSQLKSVIDSALSKEAKRAADTENNWDALNPNEASVHLTAMLETAPSEQVETILQKITVLQSPAARPHAEVLKGRIAHAWGSVEADLIQALELAAGILQNLKATARQKEVDFYAANCVTGYSATLLSKQYD